MRNLQTKLWLKLDGAVLLLALATALCGTMARSGCPGFKCDVFSGATVNLFDDYQYLITR